MEKSKYSEQIPSAYLASVFGAEQILKKIQTFPQKEQMLLKKDDFLKKEKNYHGLVEQMEFFIPEREQDTIAREVKTLFSSRDGGQSVEDTVQIYTCQGLKNSAKDFGNPLCISLEIMKDPYRIPMDLHLIPYAKSNIYPRKHTGIGVLDKETYTYYKFPPEEYLALGFYEILSGLELLSDLSWYKEIFEILKTESLEGRKIWEGLSFMLEEHPLPFLEQRLSKVLSCRDNKELKKRWKSQSRRSGEHYANWEQTVALTVTFLTPIYDGILKDEIFLGDWMPQLGRYLD